MSSSQIPVNPAAALRKSKALTPEQIAKAVRSKGPVGPGITRSTALSPYQIAEATKKTKGGKRLPRSRRGATKKRTPKPKWASTRKHRSIHGGACGCSIPRGI